MKKGKLLLLAAALLLIFCVASCGPEEDPIESDDNPALSGKFKFLFHTQKILSENAGKNHDFGDVIDIRGNWAAIGAPREPTSSAGDGGVYVYRKSGEKWQFFEKLWFENANYNGNFRFGSYVKIYDEKLYVGAPWVEGVGNKHQQGIVIEYDLNDDQIIQNQVIWSESEDIYQGGFGGIFDVHDNFMVICASDGSYGTGVGPLGGKVFSYKYEDGAWIKKQELGLKTNVSSEYIQPSSIAVDEDHLFLGYRFEALNGTESGIVLVYQKSNDQWVHPKFIAPSNPKSGAQFGYSLSLEAGRLFVGAPLEPTEHDPHHGAGYFFKKEGNDWVEKQKLIPEFEENFSISLDTNYYLGWPRFVGWNGVAIDQSGDFLLMGTRFSQLAFLYKIENDSCTLTSIFSASPEDEFNDHGSQSAQHISEFGKSLCIDNNAILIGDPDNRENGVDAGAVFSFHVE